MQRIVLIFGFILSCVLHLSATYYQITHDFHYSRFDLEWNAETSTWQGILRVFTDDLEKALSQKQSEPVLWRLGDKNEHLQSDASIDAYATANWLLTDSAGHALEWTFLGKEVDYDITFIYLESEVSTAEWACFANSGGFFELFDDQVNEFTLKNNGAPLRIWLTSEDPDQSIL